MFDDKKNGCRVSARKKPVEVLGRSVAVALQEKVKAAGFSYRGIAEAAGMSLNRVGIIFRNEGPAINADELARIAGALSLSPSQVITEAQARVTGAAPSASSSGSDGSGAGIVARPDFGRGKSRKVRED